MAKKKFYIDGEGNEIQDEEYDGRVKGNKTKEEVISEHKRSTAKSAMDNAKYKEDYDVLKTDFTKKRDSALSGLNDISKNPAKYGKAGVKLASVYQSDLDFYESKIKEVDNKYKKASYRPKSEFEKQVARAQLPYITEDTKKLVKKPQTEKTMAVIDAVERLQGPRKLTLEDYARSMYELDKYGTDADAYFKYNTTPHKYGFMSEQTQNKYYSAMDRYGKIAVESGETDMYRPTGRNILDPYEMINAYYNTRKGDKYIEGMIPDELTQMTEGERKLYMTLHNHSEKDANDFLAELRPILEERATQKEQEETRERVKRSWADAFVEQVKSVAKNVAYSPFAAAEAVTENVGDMLFGRESDGYNSAIQRQLYNAQAARDAFTEGWHPIFGSIYKGGMSLVDSTVGSLMGMGLADPTAGKVANGILKSAGSLNMASGALTSAMQDAHTRGLSSGKQLTEGAIAGAAAYLSEKMGMERLFGKKSGGIVKNFIKGGGSETLEEGSEWLVNTGADYVIAGEKSNIAQNGIKNSLKELGLEAIGAFVSGGMASGVSAGVSNTYHNSYLEKVGSLYAGKSDLLIDLGVETAENSSYKQIGQAVEEAIAKGLEKDGSMENIAKTLGVLEGRKAGTVLSDDDMRAASAVTSYILHGESEASLAAAGRSGSAYLIIDAIADNDNVKNSVKEAFSPEKIGAEMRQNEAVQSLIETGLESPRMSLSHALALTAKGKGVDKLSDKEIGELYLANLKQVAKEGSAQWQTNNAYMRSAGANLLKNPDAMQRVLEIASQRQMRNDSDGRAMLAPTTEAESIIQKMRDGRQVTADDARFLVESVAVNTAKNGDLVGMVKLIDALDGGNTDSIGAAKAVMNLANGKGTNADYAEIRKSNGAVTVLSAVNAYAEQMRNAEIEVRNNKNGNQKGYIIKDSESDAFRKKNPEGYSIAEKMAKDLKMPVKFVDGLYAEDGTPLDGVITSEGVFINTQSENPVRFALTHEFSHRMKKAAPKEWAKYQKYVIDRLKNTPTENEGVSEYDRRYELKKGHYAENEIDEEIACDYIGDGLINDVAEMRALIKHDRSLAETIRKMWNYVCDFLGLSDVKDKATRLWIKAYDKSAKNVEKGKTGEFEDAPKFKIITMSDGSGRKYVHATQRVIKSKNPDMWESEIMDYVNSVVRKGEDVVIPLDNEESIVITGRTAWKLSGQGKLQDNYYLIKGNAAGVIDEIIGVSKSVDAAPPYKEHSDGFAKYGFDYRTAYFMDLDGKYYKLKLSIGINVVGKEAYDIESIKRETFPSQGSKAKATKATGKSPSTPMVSQDDPSVKNNSMQEDGKYPKNSVSGTRVSGADSGQSGTPVPTTQGEAMEGAEVAKLQAENAELRKQIENMSLQLNLDNSSGKTLDTAEVKRVAQKIRKTYGSKIGLSKLHQDLTKLYTLMRDGNATADEVSQKISEIADKVINKATQTVVNEEYSDLLDRIKTARIHVPESERASFRDGYEYFRKHYTMGKITLANDGIELDVLWRELCDEYPMLFDEDMNGSEERLEVLLDAIDEFSPREESVFTSETEEKAAHLKLKSDIKEMFFEIPETDGGNKYVFYDKRATVAEKKLEEAKQETERTKQKAEEKFERKLEKTEKMYEHEIDRIENRHSREMSKIQKDVERAEQKTEKTKISWNKSEVKKKIDSDYRYISRMVTDPTDARHVPEDLRASVSFLLECFNFETVQLDRIRDEGKEAESPTAVRLSKMYDAYGDIMRKAWGINTKDENTKLLDEHLSTDLQELRDEIPLDESGNFKRIQDMSIEELRSVAKVLSSIHHVITQRNKAFNENVKEEITELGEKTNADMRNVRAGRKGSGEKLDYKTNFLNKALHQLDDYLNIDNLQPYDFFHKIGGTMEMLYMEERKAFDRHIENIKEAAEVLQKATKGLDLKKLTGKHAEKMWFELQSGEGIELSKGQILSLYALYRRKQGKEHLLGGGIVTKGEATDSDSNKISANVAHRISEVDLGEIFETLTEEEKQMVHKVVSFLTKRCGAWGNETSMRLYGYEKFGEGWYFPIKASDQTLNTYYGEHGEGNIRSQGFTKQLTKKAKNAVEVGDFFDIVTSHINGMSLYNTVALPMLDMERVLNHSLSGIDSKVRAEIIRTFGKSAEEYIANFHKDLNGSRKADAKDPLEKMQSLAKRASIGMNARVFIQQPTSIARALMFLNPIDLRSVQGGVTLQKEMRENVPIAYWKSLGFRDVGTGGSLKEVLLDSEGLYSKLAMGGYGAADDFTWGWIYGAVKNEIARKNPQFDKNSEEFKAKVKERFNYIVDRSQVVDSVFHRTQSMRSTNLLTKTATMFMSEPLKTYNMYRTEILDAIKNGNKASKLTRATAVFFVSNLLLSMAQALPDTWREDDEKELYDENGKELPFWGVRYWKNVQKDMKDNINLFTYMPYAKDVWSMIQGFTQNRVEYSNLSKFISASMRLFDDEKRLGKRIMDVANPFAALFGISVGNLMRDVKGIGFSFYRGFGDEYADYAVTKFTWDVSNAKNESKFLEHYKRAMENGNADTAEKILYDYMQAAYPGQKFDKKSSAAVMSELKKLYGKTDDKNKLLYSVPDEKFSNEGNEYKFSGKEYEEYVGDSYNTLWELAEKFVESKEYKKLTDEDKVRSFGELKNYAEHAERADRIEDYKLDGWMEKVYNGEMTYAESVAERAAERDRQAAREEWKSGFKYDESKYTPDEVNVIESVAGDAASYYAAIQKGIKYDEKDLRHVKVFDDKLDGVMSIEDYAGHRAKAKKTAAMADDKPNMKRDELVAYLETTGYPRAVKSALFEAIGNSNWKNPYGVYTAEQVQAVGKVTTTPSATGGSTKGAKRQEQAPALREKGGSDGGTKRSNTISSVSTGVNYVAQAVAKAIPDKSQIMQVIDDMDVSEAMRKALYAAFGVY